MNVIPCTTWVRKGVAAATPEKVELTAQELEKIIKQTQTELQDNESDSDEESPRDPTQERTTGEPSAESRPGDEYDFEKYDDESGNIHCTISNIASFGKDGKDPLLTGDDEDSEKEDDLIKMDDNLVVIGRVEGDASILEVYVYNEGEGSFYCHHDILLPSFPLCIEWLNYDPAESKPNNLCAIGYMTPIIEVWDLDLIDCLEPAYKLGSKASKKKKLKRIGHKDAVLDLAWNENYVHVLASGSVDQTVLLWDLENGTPVNKFDSFEEKVQSIKWHPTETHELLTGSADTHVRLFDCRQEAMTKSWKAKGEVECVIWNHFDPNYCLASTSNGYISYLDVRNDNPVWEVEAHEKEITGLSLSSSCPGFLVSSSNDGTIKVWDILDAPEPWSVYEKKGNLGALQCLASNPDSAFVFAVGGDNKSHNFKVLDFAEISEVSGRFKERKQVFRKFAGEEVSETVGKSQVMDVTETMESMELDIDTPSTATTKKKKSKK